MQEVANAIAHLIGMPEISGEHYTPESFAKRIHALLNEEYGYELACLGKTLELKMTSERDFTEEEAIEALEWLVFERRLALRESEESEGGAGD